MNWLEVTAASVPEKLDELCEQLETAGVSGLVINDEASVTDFLEKNKKYWDYVDDEVFDKVKGICTVQFYLEDSPAGYEELKRIQQEVPGSYSVAVVKDEDWENNWKQYYHPIETGERLVIVPEWLEVPDSGRIPLRMDPGLIFGTGSHPTTRMCLEELENLQPRQVLDLGCGSGILGIASLLLGADRAVGVDIDDKAPKVVLENAALNGVYEDRLTVIAGDILSDKQVQQRLAGSYDLVLANIVADVIIALAPRVPDYLGEGGRFVCSGIMEGRQYEVEKALHQAGLAVIGHRKQEDWHCYIAVRKEEKHMTETMSAIVLAAGKGTRLQTEGCDLPKVMRIADGKPLLHYVLQGLDFIDRKNTVVVVGYKKEAVMEGFPDCRFAEQKEQLGTGHAVMAAEEELADFDGPVLVCCGDMPLITRDTYQAMANTYEKTDCACVILTGTSDLNLPYGRIVRTPEGNFDRVVEEKDCTPEQKAITELNTGVYVFDSKKLFKALKSIQNDNAQGEYYLTDVPTVLQAAGERIALCKRELGSQIIGVNTVEQLQQVEDILRSEK